MRGTKINFTFGAEVTYEDADLCIDAHDRVGIVGENGAGETTLSHTLLYEQELDNDTISAGDSRTGYLPQETIIEDKSRIVFKYLKGRRPINKLEVELNVIHKELESTGTTEHAMPFKQTEKLQSHLESYDYYEVDSILLYITDCMGISSGLLDTPLNRLSGGQKSQIAFGCALYSGFDILLLDEPTDHPDTAAKEFIIELLRDYQGMVPITNRNVNFLNQIADKILFIHKTIYKVSVYEGSYDTYRKKYASEQHLWE